MTEEDKNPLARWSELKRRTKLKVEDGVSQPLTEIDEEADAEAVAEDVPEVIDEKLVAELPPVEELGKDSDYKPFLQQGVPKKLARAALRKMWMSDPAFNVIDGLDDYAEDYSMIGMVDMVLDSVTGKIKMSKPSAAEKEENAPDEDATAPADETDEPDEPDATVTEEFDEATASADEMEDDGTSGSEQPVSPDEDPEMGRS